MRSESLPSRALGEWFNCGFHEVQFALTAGQERKTERAIISSSSVRMTRTVTRLAVVGNHRRSLRIARFIQFDAEKVQTLTDARADGRRIFADAAGENERVQATSAAANEPIHFFA